MSNITNDFPSYSQAFLKAYGNLQGDIEGIYITQDPARDWKALIWKNNHILELHGFVFEALFTTEANGDYKIELRLIFKLTGEVHNAVQVLKKQKHIKFIAYENNCAWEIRTASWFVSLDSIRAEVERVKNPQN